MNPSLLEISGAATFPNRFLEAAVSIAPVDSCTNVRRFNLLNVRPHEVLLEKYLREHADPKVAEY
jgi:hypothetical protein